MAHDHRAQQQWQLTKNETFSSFENWRQNLLHNLSLDPNFAEFLAEGTQWQKRTAAVPTRGFMNDGDEIPEALRKTAVQKAMLLDIMLGQIAYFCPIIAPMTITKRAKSLDEIWLVIRQHFGFQSISLPRPSQLEGIINHIAASNYD